MTFGLTLHKVLDGTQTQTRRPIGKRNTYRTGKVYGVQEHITADSIAFIKLTSAREQLLGAVTEEDAQAEGYLNLADFVAAWTKQYGTFDPSEDVWKLEFELIDRSELSSYDLYKLEKTRLNKIARAQTKANLA